jgi:hypothetical protein
MFSRDYRVGFIPRKAVRENSYSLLVGIWTLTIVHLIQNRYLGGEKSWGHTRETKVLIIRLRSDLTAVYVTRGFQKCPDSFYVLTNHITGPSESIPLVTSGVLWEKAPMVLLSL